ncbi:hypothetical protein V2J09_002944 [Rumex salicifolius]
MISLETDSFALLSYNEQRQHISGDKSQGDGLYTSNNQERGRQKEKQTDGKNNEKNSEGSSKFANVVQNDSSKSEDSDMLSIMSNSHMDSLILDSGCLFHMTLHREWFETYKDGNLGSVRLGDDI